MEAVDPLIRLPDGPATRRMRQIDWQATGLGAPATWPEALKTFLMTMCASLESMLVMVGPERVQIYNDAYIEQGTSRHPMQMGQAFGETWPEIEADAVAKLDEVLRQGKARMTRDSLLPLIRHDRLVDTYMTYSASPLFDGEGRPIAVLVIPVETTRSVLEAARRENLIALSDALDACETASAFEAVTRRALATSTKDRTGVRLHRLARASVGVWPPVGTSELDNFTRRQLRSPDISGRLYAGVEVHAEHAVLMPLQVKADLHSIRFITFRLDPRLDFDEPYRGYLRQITQRIAQASDRLEAITIRAVSENERNELLQRAPVPTAVLTGPQLVFSLANDRYCQMVGKRELIGLTYEEAFPELVGTAFPPLLHDLYETGRSYVSPETLMRLDRERRGEVEDCWLQFCIQPLRDIEGDVYAIMAVVVDLTDQVRARQASEAMHAERQAEMHARAGVLEATIRERTLSLQQANAAMSEAHASLLKAAAFTRTVTEMVPGRIVYWDADLVCRFANENFCRWMSRAASDVVGSTMLELLGDDVVARTMPHVAAVLGGTSQSFQSERVLPGGRTLHAQVYYTPEPALPGQRPGFYQLAIDITALKEAESSLRALNVDLARSRDAAEAASRAKSAFLANMSHEIRTPLNAILGMTHILSRRITDSGQLVQLGKVDTAGKHLLGLISDLLDLSKIEAGKLLLEANDFRMSDVIAWSLDMVRGTIVAKGLRLVDDTAGLPEHVRGDSLRLSQVLLNLLSNAAKFTNEGSIVLHAMQVESAPGRHRLHFEVRDTGIGIDESKREAMFGAFEQADNSNSRRHGGTGLGLALSRELSRAMGGDVGYESQLGVGSVFWFDVWLDTARNDGASNSRRDARPDVAAATLEDLEALVRRAHAGKRVLLAEDNPVNLEVGVALLQDVGLVVDTAKDGAEAVVKTRGSRFDLVLMDMQMPGVDGLEAARGIRAEMNPVPIIAMTANAFVADRRACLEAGMDDHISKPVRPEVLYQLLLKWLVSAQQSKAA